MKISVITVCLNNVKTIQRTLNSVTSQNWSNIEHIIIDGGSTDGTLELIKNNNPFLAHLSSGPDAGIYDAINKGLEVATGDIICVLNADDYYPSDRILSFVVTKMCNSNLDILMGDVVFFSSKNPERTVRRYRSNRFKPSRLGWGWMPAHPALFIKRDVIDRVGIYKKDYKIAGDFEYIVRIFKDSKLRYEHVSEVFVRMQIGGISTKGIYSKFILNREVLKACRENGIKTNLFKILCKYPIKYLESLFH